MANKRKKLMLVSDTPYDWPQYCEVLDQLLGRHGVEIQKESITEFQGKDMNVDVVLVSDSIFTSYLSAYLPVDVPILWINHSLERSVFEKIRELCQKGSVSVAADSLYYAEDRRRALIGMGIPPQCLHAWSWGETDEELCDQVIQYEDTVLPDREKKEVVSIRGRGQIAVDTLVQMLDALERMDLVESPFFRAYSERIQHYQRKSTDTLDVGTFYSYVKGFGIPKGCLMFSPSYEVYYCDEDARILMGKPLMDIIGKTVYEIFPFLNDNLSGYEDGKVIRIGQRQLLVQVWLNTTHEHVNGYVLISDYAAEVKKEARLRKSVTEQKHVAKYTFRSIQGESAVISKCIESARKMAKADANVLIEGPSGTGKELFAHAIHQASGRGKYPFVCVNCGALVETLLESELFGYEGGAFTGARKGGKIGFVELAHKGTLFLDEIGEMPPSLQVKLLRVLQEHELVRVGGEDIIPVDIRIIAATNRDLREEVRKGRFRLDLYYRLNVLLLRIPGLNQRREDIMPLFYAIAKKLGYQLELSEEAASIIRQHNYEGNVRELQNCVEYLGNMERSYVRPEDLPIDFQPQSEAVVEPVSLEGCEEQLVLDVIRQINFQGRGAGRRSIVQQLRSNGSRLSEVRVRKIISALEAQGQIMIGKGRMGIWSKSQKSQ